MYGSVTCPQPLITHSSGIENGIILCYTGTSVGSTAYYYCLSCDYKTISNSEVITKKTCMEDGSWRINVTTPQIECNCKSLHTCIDMICMHATIDIKVSLKWLCNWILCHGRCFRIKAILD